MSFSIHNLSFSMSLTASNPLFLKPKLSSPPFLQISTIAPKPTIIRMGGGPRTFPGGVSKWQWKRMQAKKAKQLLKARLCRERQIYEMRKRAELKAAVSELERPWEVVEKAPNLFSVRADEQVKVLADRFQKPGGFDMWTERDGPQLFQTPDELPSARFFPKGVVHSVKPYRRISGFEELEDEKEDFGLGDENHVGLEERPNGYRNRRSSERKLRNGVGDFDGGDNGESSNSNKPSAMNGQVGKQMNGRLRKKGNGRRSFSEGESEGFDGGDNGESSNFSKKSLKPSAMNGQVGKQNNGRLRKKGDGRRYGSAYANASSGSDSEQGRFDRKQRGQNRYRRSNGSLNDSQSEVCDMSLRQDGTYGFHSKNGR
ncbi:hypothetical protein UlMin_000413 [Ulmus minor]